MHAILRLTRIDKPIGTLLLLWPTIWGLVVAGRGNWDGQVWAIFLGGIVIMRAAGCVINDLADSDIDGHVQRTKARPLAAGEVSKKQAWVVFVILMTAAFFLACQLNAFAFRLAWVAAALAVIYPLTKRFFSCPQAVLGLAFSMGIPMAFAQIQNAIPTVGWCLFALSAIWAIIYDTEYAMVDRNDDLRLGLRSSAILFGELDRSILVFLSLLKLTIWIALGIWQHYLWPFWLSLIGALAMFMLQWHLIWSRERDPCFRAFLNNQWVGMLLALGLIGDQLIKILT